MRSTPLLAVLSALACCLSAPARAALVAGRVDTRLLITLAAMAAQGPVDVLAFGGAAPGASPGVPLRTAELAGPAGPSGRSYVRSVRVFLAWSARPEGGKATVGASPTVPKGTKPVIDVLTREEIQRMENAVATERDKLIIRILADCGLRLGELLSLRVEDIQEIAKGRFALKVHGKGSRDRLVPLKPDLHRRLRRFLAGRHAEGRNRVLVSLRKGADGRYAPLTESGAGQVVRIAAQNAGITKRVYPHLLRHSYATQWLRNGGNVISLQRVLGHSDLSMITGVYSHLDTGDDYDAAMKVLLGDE